MAEQSPFLRPSADRSPKVWALQPLDRVAMGAADANAPVLDWPVALVSMPFGPSRHPAMQLGHLKALGAQSGFDITTFHLGLDFAVQIGAALYERLGQMFRDDLIGDWLFSLAAFGEDAPDRAGALLDSLEHERFEELAVTREHLEQIRAIAVPRYIERMLTETDWGQYPVIGFTSTFQQNVASLALAKRLKARFPQVTIIFGGANCEDDMGIELITRATCVDYVALGEADDVFGRLLHALHDGRDPLDDVPGLAGRRNGVVYKSPEPPPFERMDSLPSPDYDEYFERAERVGLMGPGERHATTLPFESARGCWWGAKQHCTFCGLNRKTMAFRAKSPGRVAEELSHLVSKYGTFKLYAVDNIVSIEYLTTLFAEFQDKRTDYEIFYETKASLTREQIKTLRLGGVKRVQPGIESLSTPILKLMRKGTTALQNINFLRWTKYYGIEPSWNLLWGFHGERPEWYAEQVQLMATLVHLTPPGGAGRLRMERYSPIFTDPQTFPREGMRPVASYSLVYPQQFNLDRLAYFFDYEIPGALDDCAYDETRDALHKWNQAWQGGATPTLTYWSTVDAVFINDCRDPSNPGRYELRAPAAQLYRACSDAPRSLHSLVSEFQDLSSREGILESLKDLLAEGLVAAENERYLTLALPATPGR